MVVSPRMYSAPMLVSVRSSEYSLAWVTTSMEALLTEST